MSKRMLILDFETMGTNTNDCAVIDCSYFIFDTDKMLSDEPYTARDIIHIQKAKLSVKEQVDKYQYVVYKDTIEFWQKQSEAARKLIAPQSSDITVDAFTKKFISYLNDSGPVDRWWSRSNSFDPIILWRLFASTGKSASVHAHLPHWKLRDIRTFIDAKLDYPEVNGFVPVQDEEFWKKIFVEHDSSWDVLADVLRYQAIIRAENDLEQIKR